MSPRQRIVRLIAEGRVQGVGFRAFVAREAERRGLSGWVRNRFDGAVEAVVAGPGETIEDMAAACRKGPMLSRVDLLRIEDADEAALKECGGARGFHVAATR